VIKPSNKKTYDFIHTLTFAKARDVSVEFQIILRCSSCKRYRIVLNVIKIRDLMWRVISAVKTAIKALYSQRLMLHKVFGLKRAEVTGDWVACMTGSFMICNAVHVLCG
jgi:hypothetical protein